MVKTFFLKSFFSLILTSVIPIIFLAYFLLTGELTYFVIGGTVVFVFLLSFVFSKILSSSENVHDSRNKEIIDNFTDSILVLDKKGRILRANSKAKKGLGVEEGELLKEFKKSVKEKDGFEKKEITLGNGTVFEKNSFSIKKGKENVLVFHDISPRKLTEELVSLSTHQLKTSLSGVKWTLKMILSEEAGELQKEQKEYLQKAYQKNDKAIQSINDLLSSIKAKEEKLTNYSKKEEDVTRIFEKTVSLFKERAEQKGLQFKIEEIKEEIPKTKIDKEKIEICMQNLIDNSLKYTEKGSVEVFLRYNKEKEEIRFCVKDTGMGIPEDQQERIFTKFFQVSKNNFKSEETAGSGLGLYITKNIVNAHGGDIWFESKKGKGSKFCFSLPV